jgi:hypothetical protein
VDRIDLEALDIVLALAEDNVLTDEAVSGDEDLKGQQQQQQWAVDTVEGYVVGVISEGEVP